MNAADLRKLESADMRRIREQELLARKRAARRVLENGGCWSSAAKAWKSTPGTVKRWAQEGGWEVPS